MVQLSLFLGRPGERNWGIRHPFVWVLKNTGPRALLPPWCAFSIQPKGAQQDKPMGGLSKCPLSGFRTETLSTPRTGTQFVNSPPMRPRQNAGLHLPASHPESSQGAVEPDFLKLPWGNLTLWSLATLRCEAWTCEVQPAKGQLGSPICPGNQALCTRIAVGLIVCCACRVWFFRVARFLSRRFADNGVLGVLATALV